MKVIIVGGVAGGATAAARLRRLDETAEIVVFERSGYVSYANCGLPYYIGGVITDKEELTLQTPESFWRRFRVDMRVRHEVTAIHPAEKTVDVRNLATGETFTESYDKLVLSPGARPTQPALPGVGIDRLFTLRTVEDTLKIREFIEQHHPRSAVLAGGGFIGVELMENLRELGIDVTVVQRPRQLLNPLDADMAAFLHASYPDEALDILTHTADGGLTSLRANPLKGTPEALCEKLLASGAKTAAPGLLPGSVLARFEGSPAESGLFRDGYFHVEGQASQLAALCVEAKPGDTVLDLCAAPGGKTLLLAEEMQGTGRLISCDVTENRVQLIAKAVERMGFTACVETLCNDASRPNPKLPQADRILVDAPCSGLGILAKKPDIRYKSLPKARHDELLATQSAILDTAASLLKAGGRLVYSTCTIDPAENEEQVAAFLNRHPEFRVVTPEVPFPQGMTVGEHGALSVPTRSGMDGFFLCAMQKQ